MKKGIKFRRVVTLILASAVGLLTTAAGLSPSAFPTPVGPNLNAGATITLPSGVKAVLPKDFSAMSIRDLAAIGIVPGMGASDGAFLGPITNASSLRTAASASAVVTPLSATGCNGNVCMSLTGTGLTISSWQTTATLPATLCTYAAYWQGSLLLSTSPSVCGSAGDIAGSWKGGMPRTFPNNTVLCNSWVNIAGKPCETVHS